jgi:hypothetical protein
MNENPAMELLKRSLRTRELLEFKPWPDDPNPLLVGRVIEIGIDFVSFEQIDSEGQIDRDAADAYPISDLQSVAVGTDYLVGLQQIRDLGIALQVDRRNWIRGKPRILECLQSVVKDGTCAEIDVLGAARYLGFVLSADENWVSITDLSEAGEAHGTYAFGTHLIHRARSRTSDCDKRLQLHRHLSTRA